MSRNSRRSPVDRATAARDRAEKAGRRIDEIHDRLLRLVSEQPEVLVAQARHAASSVVSAKQRAEDAATSSAHAHEAAADAHDRAARLHERLARTSDANGERHRREALRHRELAEAERRKAGADRRLVRSLTDSR